MYKYVFVYFLNPSFDSCDHTVAGKEFFSYRYNGFVELYICKASCL